MMHLSGTATYIFIVTIWNCVSHFNEKYLMMYVCTWGWINSVYTVREVLWHVYICIIIPNTLHKCYNQLILTVLTLLFCHILAPNINDIMQPNETVPSDRIDPNSIIVDLPNTTQPYRYVLQISAKLMQVPIMCVCIIA